MKPDWRRLSWADKRKGTLGPPHLFRCARCGILLRVEDCQAHLSRCPGKPIGK